VRARQRARPINIKYGDANSKLFYLRANGRKRKKHIQVLQTPQGTVFSHDNKEKEIARHFGDLLGKKQSRTISLNWEELAYPSFNLDDLEAPFTCDEIKKAITDMPKENAPGPKGCIGAFYAKCGDTVKSDVTQADQQLSQLRGNTFNLLNTANIVLLLKKDVAGKIGDYMPISLVHSVAKIFSKILASRLPRGCIEMVSSSQSAFVKKRCIHDNFIFRSRHCKGTT
jgi:hypothetical protein